MNRLYLVMLIYGLIATVAYVRALMGLAEERQESREAWKQVQELRASIAGGWPVAPVAGISDER